jgi:hypothetical protein
MNDTSATTMMNAVMAAPTKKLPPNARRDVASAAATGPRRSTVSMLMCYDFLRRGSMLT